MHGNGSPAPPPFHNYGILGSKYARLKFMSDITARLAARVFSYMQADMQTDKQFLLLEDVCGIQCLDKWTYPTNSRIKRVLVLNELIPVESFDYPISCICPNDSPALANRSNVTFDQADDFVYVSTLIGNSVQLSELHPTNGDNFDYEQSVLSLMHRIASQGNAIRDSLLNRTIHTFDGLYDGCRLKEVTAAVMRSSSYVYYYEGIEDLVISIVAYTDGGYTHEIQEGSVCMETWSLAIVADLVDGRQSVIECAGGWIDFNVETKQYLGGVRPSGP